MNPKARHQSAWQLVILRAVVWFLPSMIHLKVINSGDPQGTSQLQHLYVIRYTMTLCQMTLPALTSGVDSTRWSSHSHTVIDSIITRIDCKWGRHTKGQQACCNAGMRASKVVYIPNISTTSE